MLVQAVGAAAALLREVAARAVVVCVRERVAGDVVPPQAEAERDHDARVRGHAAPEDPGAEVAVGALVGAEVDGGGGREECGEDGELGGDGGETHCGFGSGVDGVDGVE